MAEPLPTSAMATAAGWGLVASTLIGFITSVDYSIVFGAFAGSMFFVVTAQKLTRRQTPGYFVFGYAAGIFGAGLLQIPEDARRNAGDAVNANVGQRFVPAGIVVDSGAQAQRPRRGLSSF